jgi:hypothetical protein
MVLAILLPVEARGRTSLPQCLVGLLLLVGGSPMIGLGARTCELMGGLGGTHGAGAKSLVAHRHLKKKPVAGALRVDGIEFRRTKYGNHIVRDASGMYVLLDAGNVPIGRYRKAVKAVGSPSV